MSKLSVTVIPFSFSVSGNYSTANYPSRREVSERKGDFYAFPFIGEGGEEFCWKNFG